MISLVPFYTSMGKSDLQTHWGHIIANETLFCGEVCALSVSDTRIDDIGRTNSWSNTKIQYKTSTEIQNRGRPLTPMNLI